MVDIESDGPMPHDYSMICFGAEIAEPELNRSFRVKLRLIADAVLQMKEMGLKIGFE